MALKIYIAGPEVFLPDGRQVLAEKAALTRDAGFEPICPGDLEVPAQPSKKQFGMAINAIDEQMMLSADAVIANLTPFRGLAADTGTAYELGFMCALDKIVVGYTNMTANHYQRIVEYYGGNLIDTADGHLRGPDGLSVEDFDMVDNLMLHGGIERRGGFIVVGNAPADHVISDLTAFRQCLALLVQRG